MRGIGIIHKLSYREISPMLGSLCWNCINLLNAISKIPFIYSNTMRISQEFQFISIGDQKSAYLEDP